MCYYARTDFGCRDWKWGNMMLRCPRQPRIGETCGAKLVHDESITRGPALCKTCEDIETKKRRLAKICDNITRWSTEGGRFAASLAKAQREKDELVDKIRELNANRPSVKMGRLDSSPPTPNVAVNMLPPMSTSVPSSGYEYVSSQMTSTRRQDNSAQSIPRNGIVPQMLAPNMVTYNQAAPSVPQHGLTYPRNGGLPGQMAGNLSAVNYSVNRR